jgi:MFS family permease
MSTAPAAIHRKEVGVVRTAAVAQGLALVIIPTLSTVLTDPHRFALTQESYGTLFVPQSVLAIAFSLAGGRLTRRFGVKRVLLAGLAADAVSMTLLASTAGLMREHALVYAVLLSAAGCLGLGFAVVTPALNLLAGEFAPRAVDRAVLIVNALLGSAAALAPLLLVGFVRFGVWWALPTITGAAMASLFALSARLPFAVPKPPAARSAARMPARFRVFAAFALIYGFCEQMNGSWAALYITGHLNAPEAYGLIALTVFWAFATAGRVVFAVYSRYTPPTIVFRVLPFLLAAALLVLGALPAGAGPLAAVAAFALAGLGASALLPLVISFCERSIPEQAVSATSTVFAIYLIGYGLAAYGAGPLQRLGLSLQALYGASVVPALCCAGLAFAIVRTLGSKPSADIIGGSA